MVQREQGDVWPSVAGVAPPPTPHMARLPYLDGWRGLSILLVLTGHFICPRLPGLDPALRARVSAAVAVVGVQMFFALSGRLMADILFVERFPLREFYKRRFSRIYPGLFVFVVLTFFLVGGTQIAFRPSAAALGLTFLLNYAMVLYHSVPALENLWSLCIEEHSYLLLGVLAFLLRRHGGRGTAGALFLVAAASLLDLLLSAFLRYPLGQALSLDIGTQQGRLLFWRSDAQLAAIFLAGALYLRLRTRQVPGLLPCAALLCGAAAQFISPLLGFSIGTALFSLAIARLDDAPASLRHALAWKPLAWLGLASYSIYLWQQPLYWFAADRVLGWLPGLALAIAAGILSFYLVERPARRWLNANWHSTTGDRSLARANGFESSGAFDAAAPE